jgi:hypothetical protein
LFDAKKPEFNLETETAVISTLAVNFSSLPSPLVQGLVDITTTAKTLTLEMMIALNQISPKLFDTSPLFVIPAGVQIKIAEA